MRAAPSRGTALTTGQGLRSPYCPASFWARVKMSTRPGETGSAPMMTLLRMFWGFAVTSSPEPVGQPDAAGPSRRSAVVLGLVPGATAKAPLPAAGTVAGEPCRRNAVPVPPAS